MLDLKLDFGDGKVKNLLDLTDIEFSVITKFVAANCLILSVDCLPGQNVAARIEIEKVIRAKGLLHGQASGQTR